MNETKEDRSRLLVVRVTAEEREAIHQSVRENTNMSTGEYIRSMLLGEFNKKP